MNSLSIGFIGGGALTESIVKGIAGKHFEAAKIFVSDHKQARCDELVNKYQINASVGADSFINKLDMLVIAVKPKDAENAMLEVSGKVSNNTIIISVVAGLSLSAIEKYFKSNTLIRTMPNVAISVGSGMTAFVAGGKSETSDIEIARQFLSSFGRCVEVDEKLMDAVTGLSGSGSAYAFLIIDALADGGVAVGLPRAKSIELAAQTLFGAAKMVLETGEHPDVLRDKVTSPAGTTIEGIRTLEKYGVRSALIEAVISATNKSKAL